MTVVIADADFTQHWTIHYCRHAKLKTTNGNNNNEEEEKGGRGKRGEEGEEEEKRKEVTEKEGKEGKVGRGRKKRRKERRNGKKEQKTLLRKFFEPKPLIFRCLSLTGLNTQFQQLISVCTGVLSIGDRK